MLKRLITMILLAVAGARAQGPATTSISDTFYYPAGTRSAVSIKVSNPQFTSPDGYQVGPAVKTYSFPTGAVSLSLVPTQGGTPGGAVYVVDITPQNGPTSEEWWSVPLSTSPLTIQQVVTYQNPIPNPIIGIPEGGTGATTAQQACSNLGCGISYAVFASSTTPTTCTYSAVNDPVTVYQGVIYACAPSGTFQGGGFMTINGTECALGLSCNPPAYALPIGGIVGAGSSSESSATIPWFSSYTSGTNLNGLPMPVSIEMEGLTYSTSAIAVGGSAFVQSECQAVPVSFLSPEVIGIAGSGAAGLSQTSLVIPSICAAGSSGSFQEKNPSGTTAVATANIAGLKVQVLGDWYGSSVSPSTSAYSGPSQGTSLSGSTETSYRVPLPYNTTVTNFCVSTSTSQPSSGALTVTMYKDGSAPSSGPIVTIPANGSDGTYCDATHTVSFVGGADTVDWQVSNAATSSSATVLGISAVFSNPSSGPTGMIVYGLGSISLSLSTPYLGAFGDFESATESFAQAPMPRAAIAQHLSCWVNAPPSSNPAVLSLRVNGVSPVGGPSVGISTSATGFIEDLTGIYSLSTLNLFNLMYGQAGGGGAPSASACTLEID